MSKHTPGPWTVDNYGTEPSIRASGGSVVVPQVWGKAEDARLIAAAPDLLAAAQALDSIDCCTGYSLNEADYPKLWDALEKARTAIAKATGQTATEPAP